MDRTLRRAGAAAMALVLTAGPAVGAPAGRASGAPRIRQWVTTVAPGLTLRRIVDLETPRRIFVLTVDPAESVTMDVALAEDRFPGFETTSSMAKRHGAIAAVNGDFGGFSGLPTHPFAEDGDLKRTSAVSGVGFAVSEDEQSVFVERPEQIVTATLGSGEVWRIDHWNDGPPGLGEIVAFNPAGGSLETPPPYACSVRLLPAGPPRALAPEPGIARSYTVDQAACPESPMARRGGVVLSALPTGDEAEQLLSLTAGETVTLTWSFGWPDVFDAIGGQPLLVSDGEIAVDGCTSSFCRRHPRTGVGVTADGYLLLVVVDGRRSGYSVGMSLTELARLFQELGATWALNLDGGGSSTVVVNGEVVNRPSDPRERKVSSALLVLPGPDEGEAALAPSTAAVRGAPGPSAFLDPGSTGGMLDALARGELGFGAARLPGDLLRALRLFRASR